MHVKMLFQKWVMCTKFEIYLFITVAPIINISLLEVVIDQFKGKNPCGIMGYIEQIISPHQYISSLVILKSGYNKKENVHVPKHFIISEQTVYITESL
jgi:hypothetical protein